MSQSKRNFFQDVYELVALIPEGRVTTYGAIAKYLGAGKSSRMVGYALNQSFESRDPLPAHRVVNRLGILSGRHHFPEDRPMDESLRKEGIEVVDHKVVNFDELFWDPSKELL